MVTIGLIAAAWEVVGVEVVHWRTAGEDLVESLR